MSNTDTNSQTKEDTGQKELTCKKCGKKIKLHQEYDSEGKETKQPEYCKECQYKIMDEQL